MLQSWARRPAVAGGTRRTTATLGLAAAGTLTVTSYLTSCKVSHTRARLLRLTALRGGLFPGPARSRLTLRGVFGQSKLDMTSISFRGRSKKVSEFAHLLIAASLYVWVRRLDMMCPIGFRFAIIRRFTLCVFPLLRGLLRLL